VNPLLAALVALLHGFLDFVLGLAGALLDAADKFILLAFNILKVVVREFRKLLFELALGDIPISFCLKIIHNSCFFFPRLPHLVSAARRRAAMITYAGSVPCPRTGREVGCGD